MRAARAAVLVLCAAAAGCGSTVEADSGGERRAYAQVTKSTTLTDLDAAAPGTGDRLAKAPGWAVFSTIGARVFLGDSPGGFGVAHDTVTGVETYMRMSEPRLGDGAGGEHFRAVFVFRDEKTFRQFVDKGWDFASDSGASGIDVLQLTDAGGLTPPTLTGTKFWKDRELN